MDLIQIIIIGISLSMDAFSLAMIYGTLNLEKKMINFLSIVVGCYHFLMPILGCLVGELIISIIVFDPNRLVGIIFIFFFFVFLLNIKDLDSKQVSLRNVTQAFLFGLSVSIDSFSVGIGLGATGENMLICGLVFSICSAFFTKFGLTIGKQMTLRFGKIANIIGSLLLLFLGIEHLFLV